MARVICLIDGFNLYHAIDRLNCPPYKWCDYWKLAARFVRSEDTLERVYCFTALPYWKPEQLQRHHKFIAALSASGVEVVLGKFKAVKRFCKRCQQKYGSHEEKRTDVNLAAHLVHLAHIDAFDTALIVSSDSDYTSAITMVRACFPGKNIGVVFPVGKTHSDEMEKAATFHRFMKIKDLRNSLMPERILMPDGTILLRPSQYHPIV